MSTISRALMVGKKMFSVNFNGKSSDFLCSQGPRADLGSKELEHPPIARSREGQQSPKEFQTHRSLEQTFVQMFSFRGI